MSNIIVKTVDRYGIRDKVCTLLSSPWFVILLVFQLGWGTADNAANNDTCMKAIAREIDPNGSWWDPIERRVRCAFFFLVQHVEKGLM